MADPAETRALVRRYLDAFNASDFDAMEATLHEDVAHDANQGGREIGREAFRRFNMEMARHYDERLSDVVVMVDEHGSRAAAEFTVRGIYRETADGMPKAADQSYALPVGIFFVVDDGEITRVSTYYNLADWKRQVGS